MFDTFDILVPRLVPMRDAGVRQGETAFGPDDIQHLDVGDTRLGRVWVASKLYSNLVTWTGSLDRANWTVIVARDAGNAAARLDPLWKRFCWALRCFLLAHPTWRVQCESDCDQHQIEKFSLGRSELVDLLDGYRARRHYPIAFVAEVEGNST